MTDQKYPMKKLGSYRGAIFNNDLDRSEENIGRIEEFKNKIKGISI